MISGMVLEITGGYVIPYAADEGGEPVMIDFSPPWRRISMIEGLEEATGVKFPHMEDPGMAAFLEGICKKNNVICGAPRTVARLVDKLVGHFLEEDCMNPTFITDHPEMMSPLAKAHRSKPGMTERFELFVCKREVCNSYTELNSPMVQRQRFAEQAKQATQGDDEAQVTICDYCNTRVHHIQLPSIVISTMGVGVAPTRFLLPLVKCTGGSGLHWARGFNAPKQRICMVISHTSI